MNKEKLAVRKTFKLRCPAYLKSHMMLYAMMAPGVIALVLFSYIPMYGIIMAFQDFNVFDGYFGSAFVGLQLQRLRLS